MPDGDEITRLLWDWSQGDGEALEKLTPLVYGELHRMAHQYVRRERGDAVLQTTVLINEAYLRLIPWKNVAWQNRAQFLALSARLMRRVLVDLARSRDAGKRGGGTVSVVAMDEAAPATPDRARQVLALDDALRCLATIDPRKSQIVELRFFGGLTLEETAEALNVSSRTVSREWDLAKAWLRRELDAEKAHES
jgi:RNA polymerase sigma factor (TIGR02999 family)